VRQYLIINFRINNYQILCLMRDVFPVFLNKKKIYCSFLNSNRLNVYFNVDNNTFSEQDLRNDIEETQAIIR